MKHRFVFFGTPYVARDTLASLLDAGFVPEVVVSNPDAPRGRGLVLTPSETKSLAIEKNIPVLTPAILDESFLNELAAYDAEYAVVVAYGKLFPESLLSLFPKGVLNVHYSLLPKYRGASPVESALRAGEKITGVTIQKMIRKMDAGDIIAQETIDILPDETAKELKPRLIALGSQLLVKTLPKFEAGEITPTPQDDSEATRAPKFTKEDGALDLSASAEENWNKYRAYAEWPGTYFFENGKRMKITKAHFANGSFVIDRVIPEGRSEQPYNNS